MGKVMFPMERLDAETVKGRVAIERLLAKYNVKLKRTPKGTLMGKCPFHQDRSPSLSVDPTKGVYHCFGCEAAGDAITFIGQMENLDFPTALRRVAEFTGMAIPGLTQPAEGSGDARKAATNGSTPTLEKQMSKSETPGRVVETYCYCDEQSKLLYEVQRLEPKSFRQRRPDGKGGLGLEPRRGEPCSLPASQSPRRREGLRLRGRAGCAHARIRRRRRHD